MTQPDTEAAAAVVEGRYRLEELLGRGGMGTVWRATDTVLERQVAVKIVSRTRIEDAETRERFRREARSVARLAHPRIAAVYDYDEADEGAILVMELVQGESLARRMRRDRTVPAPEAALIAAETAEALEAAHRAGIVHRDVKPGNIMLTGTGVKVVDFGIATTMWDPSLTTTDGLIGTAAYVSPERAVGRAASAGSDLYSLGIVLYEMLAGRSPHRADNPVALLAARALTAPRPLPESVPPAVARACMHLLEADPDERPASAAAAAVRLRAAAAAAGHGEPHPPAEQAAEPGGVRLPGAALYADVASYAADQDLLGAADADVVTAATFRAPGGARGGFGGRRHGRLRGRSARRHAVIRLHTQARALLSSRCARAAAVTSGVVALTAVLLATLLTTTDHAAAPAPGTASQPSPWPTGGPRAAPQASDPASAARQAAPAPSQAQAQPVRGGSADRTPAATRVPTAAPTAALGALAAEGGRGAAPTAAAATADPQTTLAAVNTLVQQGMATGGIQPVIGSGLLSRLFGIQAALQSGNDASARQQVQAALQTVTGQCAGLPPLIGVSYCSGLTGDLTSLESEIPAA